MWWLTSLDDFEVAIFLRESGTRHALLTKQKTFKSNSSRLTGAPILVESDEEDGSMADIPATTTATATAAGEDAEKKLRLETGYDGFGIWGWVLCLLVTRKGRSKASGQALMEEWMGTQMEPGIEE